LHLIKQCHIIKNIVEVHGVHVGDNNLEFWIHFSKLTELYLYEQLMFSNFYTNFKMHFSNFIECSRSRWDTVTTFSSCSFVLLSSLAVHVFGTCCPHIFLHILFPGVFLFCLFLLISADVVMQSLLRWQCCHYIFSVCVKASKKQRLTIHLTKNIGLARFLFVVFTILSKNWHIWLFLLAYF